MLNEELIWMSQSMPLRGAAAGGAREFGWAADMARSSVRRRRSGSFHRTFSA
jgi:hypothetical protein